MLLSCAGTGAVRNQEQASPKIARQPQGYRVRAEAQGLPWTDSGGPEEQVLQISPDALRVVSATTGVGIIVRFDKELFYSLDPAAKTYQEEALSALAELGADRKKDREKRRKKILEKAKSDEQADEYLEHLGLRRDGRTIVKVEKAAETEEIGGHACTLWRVIENGVTVMSIWSAPELDRPGGLMRLFGESGIFSWEMAEGIRKVPGFPMRLEIEMDYGVSSLKLAFQVSQVERAAVGELEMDLPEGFAKVEKDGPGDTLLCPICSAPVKATSPWFLHDMRAGKTYNYDSEGCKAKDKERMREEWKRRSGG